MLSLAKDFGVGTNDRITNCSKDSGCLNLRSMHLMCAQTNFLDLPLKLFSQQCLSINPKFGQWSHYQFFIVLRSILTTWTISTSSHSRSWIRAGKVSLIYFRLQCVCSSDQPFRFLAQVPATLSSSSSSFSALTSTQLSPFTSTIGSVLILSHSLEPDSVEMFCIPWVL